MRCGRRGQSHVPAPSLCSASPRRLAATAAQSHQPPSPCKAGTKLLSSPSSQELGTWHQQPYQTALSVYAPSVSHCSPSPGPVLLPSVLLEREENGVRVACLMLVLLLPCSEGLKICHSSKNDTTGRFYGICKPQCQHKA